MCYIFFDKVNFVFGKKKKVQILVFMEKKISETIFFFEKGVK